MKQGRNQWTRTTKETTPWHAIAVKAIETKRGLGVKVRLLLRAWGDEHAVHLSPQAVHPEPEILFFSAPHQWTTELFCPGGAAMEAITDGSHTTLPDGGWATELPSSPKGVTLSSFPRMQPANPGKSRGRYLNLTKKDGVPNYVGSCRILSIHSTMHARLWSFCYPVLLHYGDRT